LCYTLYMEARILIIRLPKSIDARLEKFAKRTGRSKGSLASDAILSHLDDLEDIYLAEAALSRFRAGMESVAPLKTVMKRFRNLA
jgi:RHH-type rel operon transcriptional repressor/antitoxin RelB